MGRRVPEAAISEPLHRIPKVRMRFRRGALADEKVSPPSPLSRRHPEVEEKVVQVQSSIQIQIE